MDRKKRKVHRSYVGSKLNEHGSLIVIQLTCIKYQQVHVYTGGSESSRITLLVGQKMLYTTRKLHHQVAGQNKQTHMIVSERIIQASVVFST